MGGQCLGGNAHGFSAIECHRTNVSGFQLVVAHGSQLGFHQGFLVIGHLHAEDVCGAKKAVGMILQAEDCRAFIGLVCTYAFKHAQAIVQAVSQYMGGGIAPRNHLAIIPDKTIAVSHGLNNSHLQIS